jgi:hypothetical protein
MGFGEKAVGRGGLTASKPWGYSGASAWFLEAASWTVTVDATTAAMLDTATARVRMRRPVVGTGNLHLQVGDLLDQELQS